VLLWVALVGWLGWLLYSRANWTREADQADLREWLNETRVFRKTLPDLVNEYAAAADADPGRYRAKHDELSAHLAAMAEPTRKYAGKLPLFPDVYTIAVEYPGRTPPPGRDAHPAWVSPLPRPGADAKDRVRVLEYPAGGSAAVIRCEYRVHTNNRFEQEQKDRRTWQIPLVAFLVPSTAVAGYALYRFLRREQQRLIAEEQAKTAAEHREREVAEAQARAAEAKAAAEKRAAEAERAALELKSQLYANIGVMAASYAHNIKNLLVRPNDLLVRCAEGDGMTREQHGMLQEVRASLGTVTERLQQILRTVRRDPSRAEMTRVDLGDLVRDAVRTWAETARDKWKVVLTAEVAPGPLPVNGDLSHLQQAVENLITNARDATFEMRNHLREEARKDASLDAAARRQRLIDAAAWKGEVRLRAYADGGSAVLEVRDNGIGMNEEVRAKCLTTHFTTKRDNALYEGYSAGMGLGLSFVAVVLDHHRAALEIDSAPLKGTTFRIRLPLAESDTARG
jgi:signal transduction histidine kinase